MRKNSTIILVATLMIFSSLAIGLETSATNNSNWFQASPQLTPGATEIGNITIFANGMVSNTSAIQQVGSTNTYNILTNINGTIYIQRNNTVLDGNGLTVTSNNSNVGAIASVNTSGITVKNLIMGNTSYYGVTFENVANIVVENVSSQNFNGNTLIQIYYSSNITLENENFTIKSASYAVDAQYDTSMDIYNSTFSGYVNSEIINFEYGGVFKAYGNVIMSTHYYSTGFYVYYSGASVFMNNRMNYTYYGEDVEYSGPVTSANNYVTNYSYVAYDMYYVTSFNSKNDTAKFGEYPVYLEYNGPVVIDNGDFTNYTDFVASYYYNILTISNTQMSSKSNQNAVFLEEGGNTNIVSDNISIGTKNNVNAVEAKYMSGWVNLANDTLFAPNGYGLYLYYAPNFNVTHSYLNVSYGAYVEAGSIYGATITNNTIMVQNGEYAVYIHENTVDNINFSNNTVDSAYTLHGYAGLYLYASYSTSNITASYNNFLNIEYPVYMDANSYGMNAVVHGNTIVNSTVAIDVGYYFNTVVTSNHIINVSNEGIYVYIEGPSGNVSNNYIENMPGFGGMSFGIDFEYAYSGTNVVSHNTVINAGASGEGIYIYYSFGVLVYSNAVVNSKIGFDIEDNNNILLFGNTVSNASSDGIYSNYNGNSSYYSNTVNNATISLYSDSDFGVFVYANTFYDAQKNNPDLQFLYVDYYTYLTFYHNNFINDTTNSSMVNYILYPDGPLNMNKQLPVGGNYYSNYTGTGTNGIGNTPMNITGSIQDLYPLLYEWTTPTVTFLENGLPSGTNWVVQLGSKIQSATDSSVIFQQTDGQYSIESYSVMNVPGYVASVTSGTVALNGSSNVVTIDFTPVTYGVTFTESGLANGTSWAVTLNGNTKTTAGATVTFDVSNGTYSYSIGSVSGYTSATSTGSVKVTGAPKSVSIQFSKIKYGLTVTEQGLSAGDTWTVMIGGNSYNTTNTSMVVQLTAGTYNITVTGPHGYSVTLPSSNVTVGTGNLTFNVTFARGQGVNPTVLYGSIGAAAFFGGAAGVFATMFVTGTGVFRKPEEP